MKSMAVNWVSVDWPAAAGAAPEPPEAADARAWINAVLPAPVGPTTAIALTTFADLLSGMSATSLVSRSGSGRRQRQAPLLAYVGLSRPGEALFHERNRRNGATGEVNVVCGGRPPAMCESGGPQILAARFFSSSNTRPMNCQWFGLRGHLLREFRIGHRFAVHRAGRLGTAPDRLA